MLPPQSRMHAHPLFKPLSDMTRPVMDFFKLLMRIKSPSFISFFYPEATTLRFHRYLPT